MDPSEILRLTGYVMMATGVVLLALVAVLVGRQR